MNIYWRKKNYSSSSAEMVSQPIFHQVLLPFLFCITTLSLVVADPTDGFTHVPSPSSNFHQKHYDVPQNQCYTFSNGIHRFWAYTNKSLTSSNGTRARCELRIVSLNFDLVLIIHSLEILLLFFIPLFLFSFFTYPFPLFLFFFYQFP